MREASSTVTNRNRQIVYALAILLLFTAMYPYTAWLNQLKTRKQLGEATIGQIDTGSFMLKLALLGGVRGVAANVLWNRAIDLQKVHEWDRLKQTVDMITKLQPHFLSVWTFQGWNLAYNVSVEWDDPADKYEWIKQGIKFIQDGVSKNQKSPDLLWDTAWTYYHKIGFSDEAVLLRKLFREDEDEPFKTDPIELEEHNIKVIRNDNFQLGWGWFTRAVRLVDRGAERLEAGLGEGEADIEYVDKPVQHKGRPGDLAFRSMPAHAQTRYAAGLEKASVRDYPAVFGDVASDEWRKALNEWNTFGSHTFDSPNQVPINGVLTTQPIVIDLISRPEEFDKLHENQQYWVNRFSDQMNYRYWKDRSLAEMSSEGVKARRLFYEATIAYKTANFTESVQKFKEGLELWKDLLDKHPAYRNDELNKRDTGHIVSRYVLALRQLGQEVPEDLPFKDLYQAALADPATVDPFNDLEIRSNVSEALVESARD